MTSAEALEYVIARLTHEANVRPGDQRTEVLQHKLAAIETLSALRDLIADQSGLG